MTDALTSPLLDLPGAVAGDGIDAAVAAHYGSFHHEQRALVDGNGFVDLSHRDVIRVAGPDRLTWLHALTTQDFESMAPGRVQPALLLSPQGHIEHTFYAIDDGEQVLLHTEPCAGAALIEFLERMKFTTRAEVTDATGELAVCWRPGRIDTDEARTAWDAYELVPRAELRTYADAAGPVAGRWAFDALRIARGEPRHGIDTDHRTIPNEAGWLETGVHLDKGCYRGQETVARVHNLGRPPRRLTLLHLDGSVNRLPEPGTAVHVDTTPGSEPKISGFVGSAARHHELGPIALALVKRNVPIDAALVVDGIPASQEVVVDPEVGLHVRPLR